MHSRKRALLALFVLTSLMLLTACQTKTEEVLVTQIVTEQHTIVERETIFERETIIVEVTPTPEPTPEVPRTLVICQGQEPETLYIYSGSTLAARNVQAAIYDGPIDSRTFAYQPVILPKLPSLTDGDAVIETVTVETGDLVVDDNGDPFMLEVGVLVRPAGCYGSDCAVEFDGNPLEMEQMVVTFRLQAGILWSDGEPLTAHDSVYSFEVLKDLDTPANKYTVERTASYEALDDHTTVWTGLPGYRDPQYMVNFWSPLPEHVWGEFTPLELIEAEESSRMPLSWGPYVIEEWVAGDHITLSKNGHYWRAGEGWPKFDTLIFRFVGQNSNANVAAILAGECDVVDRTAGLDDQSGMLLELQAIDKVNAAFVTGNGWGTTWEHADLGINPSDNYNRVDFLEDVRMRQAIAYCMDRQAIVDKLLFGQSAVPSTYLPSEHPLFNPDVTQYDLDVEAGIALLEEMGWIDDDGDPETPRLARDVEGVRDGTLLEFNYAVQAQLPDQPLTQAQRAAQMLQASLVQCGIKVNLEYWDRSEYLVESADAPIFGRRFDVGQFAWLTGVAPRCDLYLSSEVPSAENDWSGQNVSGFTNEEYDAACSAALQLLPGQPEYEQYHLEVQRIFAAQLPVVPLYLRLRVAASRPDLQGFFVDPTESEMWNIEEFDY